MHTENWLSWITFPPSLHGFTQLPGVARVCAQTDFKETDTQSNWKLVDTFQTNPGS